MRPKVRKIIVRSSLAVLAVIGLYAAYTASTNNFHTVIAGELYRSGQPSAEDLAAWHERYGIKTVINLQGPHPERGWYRAEKAAAEGLGMRLVDYKISADHDVTPKQVDELLDILSTAETPILVHCTSGADRTGLVSAFYIAGVAGGTELYAEFQLTPFYGHMPLSFLSFFAMDRSFEMAEPRLGLPDS